jgi:uncharacterized protein YkwD
MTRLKALLKATIVGLACAAFASGALASDAVASHRTKHAKALCAHTRKHHRRHAHRCLTRKVRAKHKVRAKRAARHPRRPFAPKQEAKREATTVTVETSPATIASVLAAPCQNTELMPETGDIEQIEQATLCLVNQERARDDELPLQLDAKLAQAAESHCQEMVSQDYFAHVAPDGETPLQRVEATGYLPNSQVGYTLGENIAWGTLSLATPSSIVAAWIASPEHLANILNSAYRETAVSVVPAAPASLAEGQAGAIYTQEFGVIES